MMVEPPTWVTHSLTENLILSSVAERTAHGGGKANPFQRSQTSGHSREQSYLGT